MPGSAGRSYRLCSESFPFQTGCLVIDNLFSTHHKTDTQRAPWGRISRALDHTRMANCTSSANQRRSNGKRNGKSQFTKEQEIHSPKHRIFVSSLFVCINFFQNTTRTENTEIGLGHFLLQELLSHLCHILLKGNQFSPTPVAFCLV